MRGWAHGPCDRHIPCSPPGEGAGEGGVLSPQRGSPCVPCSQPFLLSFQNANSLVLNNYVLGAQLGQGHVSNLNEPISISFQHNQSLVLLGVAPISTSPLPPCGSPVEFWLDQTQICGSILETNDFKSTTVLKFLSKESERSF